MKSLLKNLKSIQTILYAITFIVSGLIVNTVQCVLYILLRPLSRNLYRKINWYLSATIFAQASFVGDWWSKSNIIIYMNKDDFNKYFGNEHAFIVQNHTYEIDWLFGLMLTNRIHILGNYKAYVKKSLQYFPVLGWTMKFSEYVFLKRSFNKDGSTIIKNIANLTKYSDPMWLTLFAEGTRFTPEKHKASKEYGEKYNLETLKYHLHPRTKGFIASLPPMRGKIPAVYDILLAFKEDEVEPTIKNMLFQKPLTAHVYVKRIPMEEVPTNINDQDKFIKQMFLIKDKMKESFVKTGDFFATSGIERVPSIEMNRRLNTYINTVLWTTAIICSMIYYLIILLINGNINVIAIVVGLNILCIGLFNKLLTQSEVNSTKSSYGISESVLQR